MQLPTWPKIGYKEIKLRLPEVEELLLRVGKPHESMPPVIHIAGTNGKGSVVAYLDAILHDAGYKVHRYISPHLVRLNERIVLNGKEIEDKFLNELLNDCQKFAELDPKVDVTFFEGMTVVAFMAFSKIEADVILLETGMGGRLDATNVIKKPLATIITPISLDHGQFLGNTVEKIAGEKCGIIKESVPVFVGKQEESVLKVIEEHVKKNNASLYAFNRDWKISSKDQETMIFEMSEHSIELPKPSMRGSHQIENAGIAIATLLSLDKFKIEKSNIKNGLFRAYQSARLEEIKSGKLFDLLPENYELFLDGGHNEGAAKVIANWINQNTAQEIKKGKDKTNTYLICAMSKDKNSHDFFKYLSGSVNFIVSVDIPGPYSKSKPAIEVSKHAMEVGIKSCDAGSFEEAIKYILAIHDGNSEAVKNGDFIKRIFGKKKKNPARIVICGSLYLAGYFLEENQKI